MVLLYIAPIALSSASPIDMATNSNSPSVTGELVETNLSNFFAALSPAEGLLLPIFPAIEHFTDASENASPESDDRISIATRQPSTPHHITIEPDNIVRSEIINGVHTITSDRQSFEFKVLQFGDESDVVLTENAIVYRLPSSERSNFLITLPLEPNPSVLTATVSMAPDATISVDEQSIGQISSEYIPK